MSRPAFLPSARRDRDTRCTSHQRKTHISETRKVHYPWHPWRDHSVFIEERREKNGCVVFRCYVEETQRWSALEIPDWMFDPACSTLQEVDTPLVECRALRNLKVLLAGASSHDPIVMEAQRFEGGADATETESKTISIGIIPSVTSDPRMGGTASGDEAKDDQVTFTIASPALGEPTRPPEQGAGHE